ncbi:MAG TPA: paraquat-inducible protein A [Candidatus Paenalcaligenes intestinipullorum]|uniref:Paraquat-inducible protein A n=1 Tax=Candidatus Paenalcaligenes intestinipullorum TaxID=2838718 RepID=A0A9D2U7J4_9BURK|nr:paraquat-inducible protein A [Candidatus Paenalcaligenes intestinipullorum]
MSDNLAVTACPHCDALHQDIALQAGESATCGQCASELYRYSSLNLSAWLALLLATLVFFIMGSFLPVAHIHMQGQEVSPSLFEAVYFIWDQGHYVLATMTGLVSIWLPLFYVLFRLWAVGVLLRGRLPQDFALVLRIINALQHWSLVPVVFLGMVVSLVKFAGLARLELAAGLLAYVALMFLYTATLRLTAKRLWWFAAQRQLVMDQVPYSVKDYIACTHCGLVQTPTLQNDHSLEGNNESEKRPGGVEPEPIHHCQCVRCHGGLYKRKVNMVSRTWALMLTAIVLYIPANTLPMMLLRTPISASEHTILGGVVELWESGSADLAIIVFVASIVVPFTKFLALTILLLNYKRWKGRVIQRQRTKLYRMVEFIGQWSMLDVIVVVLMAAMADFPGLSQIIAGPAAVNFGAVVVLTMLAALSFDPRCGWDARARVSSAHPSQSFFPDPHASGGLAKLDA